KTVIFTVDALSTTWALVSTSPSGVMIIPVPAPRLVRTVTTAGSTLASRSRIWLPVMSGAGAEELPLDVAPLTWAMVRVLVPRVATATPPPTRAPITAAMSATNQTAGRPDDVRGRGAAPPGGVVSSILDLLEAGPHSTSANVVAT